MAADAIQGEWCRKPIGEVAPIDATPILPTETPQKKFFYIALENIESGTGRLVGSMQAKGDSIKSNKFQFGLEHVLLGKLRPYLNKVVIPGQTGICSTDILPLKPNSKLLTREFLGWCLRSPEFIAYSSSKMEGGKMPRLRTPDLESYEIPVPPLAEQRRIVARVEALTRRLDQARQARQAALAEAASFFQRVFENEFSDAATDDWREIPAAQLFEIVSGQVSPFDPKFKHLPYLGPEHVESGTGRIIGERVSVEKLEMKSGKYVFSPEHVVYSKIRPALRKVCLPDYDGLCSADMYALKPNDDEVTREFLLFLLLAPPFSQYAVEKSDRNAMPKINQTALFDFTFRVPNKPEQKRIAKLLLTLRGKLDELQRLQREVAAELASFTPALLAKAFRGEL
jgi:type I restriction enzyme S subunit